MLYHYKEFVNAVDAWRNRGSTVSPKSSPQGIKMSSSKIPLGSASSTALALAAKISIELEDEEKQLKLFINEKREILQAKIIENKTVKAKQYANKDKDSSVPIEEELNHYTDFEQYSSEEKYRSSSSKSTDDKILEKKEDNESKNDDVIIS